METEYYSKHPRLMENDNSYPKYGPFGVCGYLQDEYGFFSRMFLGLLSITTLLLKETHHPNSDCHKLYECGGNHLLPDCP